MSYFIPYRLVIIPLKLLNERARTSIVVWTIECFSFFLFFSFFPSLFNYFIRAFFHSNIFWEYHSNSPLTPYKFYFLWKNINLPNISFKTFWTIFLLQRLTFCWASILRGWWHPSTWGQFGLCCGSSFLSSRWWFAGRLLVGGFLHHILKK